MCGNPGLASIFDVVLNSTYFTTLNSYENHLPKMSD